MKSIRGPIIAALVVTAMAVMPAAATAGISAEKYPATLSGSEVEPLILAGPSIYFVCSGYGFEASLKERSPTMLSSTFKDPKTCGALGLQMNGCQLELNPAGGGSVGIGPPGCGPVSFSNGNCKIPAQTGISATYENVGSGSGEYFNVAINDSSVEYTSTGTGCGSASKGTHNNLTVTAKVKVAANNGGTFVNAHGLSIGGSEGGQLEAPDYPQRITGERVEIDPWIGKIVLLEAENRKVSCTGASYTGSEFAAPVTSFALEAIYSGCKLASLNATVKMNGCGYAYSALKALSSKGSYETASEITCGTGKSIEIVSGGCTLSVPTQSLVSGAEESGFSNFVVNGEESILGVMKGTGVKFTASPAFNCGVVGLKSGSHENGSLESDMLLHGVFSG